MPSNSPNSLVSDRSGFTLIEVLISIVILAFISLGIYQATAETYRLREALSNEGDFYNSIRLSMTILQRDIAMMYSPIQLMPSPSPSGNNPQMNPNSFGNPAYPNPQPGTPGAPANPALTEAIQKDPDLGLEFDFWGPAIDASGVRPSRFVGTEKKITFISASHLRMYKDTPESVFAKIIYELVPDEFDKESQMLVKTESTDVFQMEDRKDASKRDYPLLHGIKKLTFRYFRKDKDNGIGAWERGWDSDSEDQKNIYPDIVEVNFEINGPSRLYFNGIYDFRPELPLNAINPSF
jgi:prepilin-type N-terminal cleavage/methylation domain-containing protein